MKGQKGITLVALVITIIVLLILAGVAISALAGQDNIFNNAQTAVDKYGDKSKQYDNLLNDFNSLLDQHLKNYNQKHPSV